MNALGRFIDVKLADGNTPIFDNEPCRRGVMLPMMRMSGPELVAKKLC